MLANLCACGFGMVACFFLLSMVPWESWYIRLAARRVGVRDRGLAKDKEEKPWPHCTLSSGDKPHPARVNACNTPLRTGVTDEEVVLWCWKCERIVHKYPNQDFPKIRKPESKIRSISSFFKQRRARAIAAKLGIRDAGFANFHSGPAIHNQLVKVDGDGTESKHPGCVSYCNNRLRIGISNKEVMLWCDVCRDIVSRQDKAAPLEEPERDNSGFSQMSDKDFLKKLGIEPEKL